jgi:hypothetical protein
MMGNDPENTDKKIELRLSKADSMILEKFRGDLSPEDFFKVVLRMLDSGAVSEIPPWIRPKPLGEVNLEG